MEFGDVGVGSTGLSLDFFRDIDWMEVTDCLVSNLRSGVLVDLVWCADLAGAWPMCVDGIF